MCGTTKCKLCKKIIFSRRHKIIPYKFSSYYSPTIIWYHFYNHSRLSLSFSFYFQFVECHRCNFKAYCLFSFFNTAVYCIPGMLICCCWMLNAHLNWSEWGFEFFSFFRCSCSAGWVWGEHGFLNSLGAVDIAGSGPVSFIPIIRDYLPLFQIIIFASI